DALVGDEVVIDPLAGEGWVGRLSLFRRGLKAYRGEGGHSRLEHHATAAALARLGEGPAENGQWRLALRSWDTAAWQELRRKADEWSPAGPGRMGRYLAGCVLRSLHRVFAMRCIAMPVYMVTLPMRCPNMPPKRPMRGNYLVSATLIGRREVIED